MIVEKAPNVSSGIYQIMSDKADLKPEGEHTRSIIHSKHDPHIQMLIELIYANIRKRF